NCSHRCGPRRHLPSFPPRRSSDLATTPAPTVLPPSRMANLKPCSIAMGAIKLTTIFTLSPGITISVPAGQREDGGELDCAQRDRSEEHTSELQSRRDLVCRLLLEK